MPMFWQWFFGILGGVAFLMTIPYILQLIFGQPKLCYSFGHTDSETKGRIIHIHLMNPPINNRLLKAFRVSRLPVQDVYVVIDVFNVRTRETILSSFGPDIGITPSDKAIRASLPASILMTNVSLARWQPFTNSAVLLGNHSIPLQEGTYGVNISIGFEGKFKAFPSPIFFHIGKIEEEMIWEKDITNKLFDVRNLP
jgi:hypothetical protein